MDSYQKEFYESDVVICNQDIYFVYERLLKNKKVAQELKQQERSTSAIIFYWGITRELDDQLTISFFQKL